MITLVIAPKIKMRWIMEKITLWVFVLMMIVALGYYTFGFISDGGFGFISGGRTTDNTQKETNNCLLYTSDAADE